MKKNMTSTTKAQNRCDLDHKWQRIILQPRPVTCVLDPTQRAIPTQTQHTLCDIVHSPSLERLGKLKQFVTSSEPDGPKCLDEHATLDDRAQGLQMFKYLNGWASSSTLRQAQSPMD